MQGDFFKQYLDLCVSGYTWNPVWS